MTSARRSTGFLRFIVKVQFASCRWRLWSVSLSCLDWRRLGNNKRSSQAHKPEWLVLTYRFLEIRHGRIVVRGLLTLLFTSLCIAMTDTVRSNEEKNEAEALEV